MPRQLLISPPACVLFCLFWTVLLIPGCSERKPAGPPANATTTAPVTPAIQPEFLQEATQTTPDAEDPVSSDSSSSVEPDFAQ